MKYLLLIGFALLTPLIVMWLAEMALRGMLWVVCLFDDTPSPDEKPEQEKP